MTIEYGTLENAKVTIDGADGAVWLWVNAGTHHAGINLSAQSPDPSIEEVVKEWAKKQVRPEEMDKWKSGREPRGMAVGFLPEPINEVEELRKAYGSLNDIARNLKDALSHLHKCDLNTLGACLRAAQWHTEQAKKSIEKAGQEKQK
jgi:hypothetical protein